MTPVVCALTPRISLRLYGLLALFPWRFARERTKNPT